MAESFRIEHRSDGSSYTVPASTPITKEYTIHLEFNIPLDEYTERVVLAGGNSQEWEEFFKSLVLTFEICRTWDVAVIKNYSWFAFRRAKMTHWRKGWLKVKADLNLEVTTKKQLYTRDVVDAVICRVSFPGYDKSFTSKLKAFR